MPVSNRNPFRAAARTGLTGAITCLLVTGAGLAAEKRQEPSPPNQAQSANHQQPANNLTPALQAPVAIAESHEQSNCKNDSTTKQAAKQPDIESIKWTDKATAFSAAMSAVFAGVLAWFTWRLIIVGGRQHKAAMAAVKLAREEFNATHRPNIRVRFIENHGSSIDNQWEATLTIVNVGDSDAIIETVDVDIARRDPLTLEWENPIVHFGNHPNIGPPDMVLASGQPETFEIASKFEIGADAIPDLILKSMELLAVGRIRYRDGNGAVRLTGFAWKLNPTTDRFERFADDEYSYED